MLNNEINDILNEKRKVQKQKSIKNQMIVPTVRGNVKKKGKKAIKNKTNFPPKKVKINFIGNFGLDKRNKFIKNKNNKKISKIELGSTGLNNINKIKKYNKNKNVGILKVNNNNKSFKNSLYTQKINNNMKIKYNDYELNSFDYRNAIFYDKRSFGEYYLSLIKSKNPIIFSFCPRKDYNSIIIRSCIFNLSFSIYYAINFAFFTDEIMHHIYEESGKYDILFFLPKILISFFASNLTNISF